MVYRGSIKITKLLNGVSVTEISIIVVYVDPSFITKKLRFFRDRIHLVD